ncbi:interleukin-5 receptor subunit alpha-like [Seriola lalandi dorsalis]|uniref:interleukin-5 receptor subunit alpha-like n=1 Tax=Seriola lalandi dorsalis TaxID=1841481 RepID=UPI000C6F5A07|nr:interleukin-5 receptor subunit alpha-like [Seriola lalandi dorsalis]
MKLFLVHPVFWSCFLVLWDLTNETEGINQDVCLEENDYARDANFTCHYYPTNLLNCSWSFDASQELSAHISICDDDDAVIPSLSQSSNERVGSMSLTVQRHEAAFMVIQFNVSLDGNWTVKAYATNDMDQIEVVSPPSNISATIKDGNLLVTWSPPYNRSKPSCFEYLLDLGDQEKPIPLKGEVSYTELNVDPTRTYRLRMRARKSHYCSGSAQWSEWSPTITVEQSVEKFSILLIVSISLGIPMILLAVLLLVRYQRVSELLFPPIPRPPPKYKFFLERNDTFNFSSPALPPKAEEEITKVEDAE